MSLSRSVRLGLLCSLGFPAFAAFAVSPSMDLAGSWRLHLPLSPTPELVDISRLDFKAQVQLPGILTAQGFGEVPSFRTAWTGGDWLHPDIFREYQRDANFKFPFFLQPPRYHVGPAYYQRPIEIPEAWQGDSVILELERPHWRTTVWIDGAEKGTGESLSTPHRIDLGPLAPGPHTLTLGVDNRIATVNVGSSAHSVSDHTQGNWNGVAGRMQLLRQSPDHLLDYRITTTGAGRVEVKINGHSRNARELVVEISALTALNRVLASTTTAVPEDGDFDLTPVLQLTEPVRPWDEFSPSLYQVKIQLRRDGAARAETTGTFGFREVASRGGKLYLNDRLLSLRGTLDCAIFPLTGHPPTDPASWQKIMRVCRSYGLNHIRYHSWCPPKAAFSAADEAGVYLQVEMATWSEEGAAALGSGLAIDAWLERETDRVLREYGNHPSLILVCHGNEPHGPQHKKFLQDYVARWRAKDPRFLYTTGAGWPLMPGSDYHLIPNPRLQQWGEGLKSRLNAKPPSTDFDFRRIVQRHHDAPVIAHESGQWCAYPDFGMIAKCSGFFQAKNYEIFRDLAVRHGLSGSADRFLRDSGRLQVLAYKQEIETALRTPGFGGFQLLSLQDFPGQGTAPVGVTDFFWDAKPYVTPGEFRRFCAPIVPLVRLPRMVFTSDETVTAACELYHFGEKPLPGCTPAWTLRNGTTVLASGTLPTRDLAPSQLHPLGSLSILLKNFPAPASLTLTLSMSDGGPENRWDLFVYPAKTPAPDSPSPDSAHLITRDWSAARAALTAGKKVFWLAPPERIGNDRDAPLLTGFSPIFWNTAYTDRQPPHTLGLSVEPAHPAFSVFPTQTHSNWQWWEIQVGSRPFILTAHPEIHPLIELIDDWFTARRLGLVFEAKAGPGQLLACGINLTDNLDRRPAARQLLASLTQYFHSPRFAPVASLTFTDIEALLKQKPIPAEAGTGITSASSEPGYPASALLDDRDETFWHTEFTARQPASPHDLTLTLPEPRRPAALIFTQRQDGSLNGQVKQLQILGADGIVVTSAKLPPDVTRYRVPLPSGPLWQQFTIRILSSHQGPFACLAGLEIKPESRP